MKIIRRVGYLQQAGELLGPKSADYPGGMFGPWTDQPRLPLFPLKPTSRQDSAFRDYEFPSTRAYLRQLSGPADSVLLNLYRSEPDTLGGHPLQPPGEEMYYVLSEMGAHRDSVIVPVEYSLQLWTPDCPWRLYEESGQYAPGGGARLADVRSWLIAWGSPGRR